jgi:hypothetical protein
MSKIIRLRNHRGRFARRLVLPDVVVDSPIPIESLADAGAARVAGLEREILEAAAGIARVSVLEREVLYQAAGSARIGGLVREGLQATVASLTKIGAVCREILVSNTTTTTHSANVGGLAREVLLQADVGFVHFSGLAREVLLTGSGPPPPSTHLRPYLSINA